MAKSKITTLGKKGALDDDNDGTGTDFVSGQPHIARVVVAGSEITTSRVQIGNQSFPLCGCVTALPGVVPMLEVGQEVLVLPMTAGMALLGIWQGEGASVLGKISMKSGVLELGVTRNITLTAGDSKIELDASGKIRIDGRDVHTFSLGPVRLQGSIIELN